MTTNKISIPSYSEGQDRTTHTKKKKRINKKSRVNTEGGVSDFVLLLLRGSSCSSYGNQVNFYKYIVSGSPV